MENTGIWVALAIIIFVLGSIFGLRVSPREKALGLMREKARKMGLHPRLVAAPDWTKIPMATESRASMVAYYSVLIPEARLPLMRARVVDQQLELVHGEEKGAQALRKRFEEHPDLVRAEFPQKGAVFSL